MSPTFPHSVRALETLVVVGFLGIGIPSPAAAQITLPGTQPGDLVNWELLTPGDCQGCHGEYVGADYEPWDSWAGNMMANATRDPMFWAAVDIANQDVPGAGEFCIRCHTPFGWLAGRSLPADGSGLEGFANETDKDFQGVSCHFCHRAYEGPSGVPFLENGQYWVDDGTPGSEPPRRGPYASSPAPHPFQYSDFHERSEFCAVCHDLRNPLVELLDEGGVSTGRQFPEQVTYTEWLQSDFAGEGTECQDCHMPSVSGYACSDQNPLRSHLPKHDFVGANVFLMQILSGEYGSDLGRTQAYAYSIQEALNLLQNQSATIELLTPPVANAGLDLAFEVRVTNLTGHKLPTAYPEGRRMWLHVEVEAADGTPVFESGTYDVPTAELVEDAQLRVYETVHGIHGAPPQPSFHLVLNDRILKDTRIPPRGFVPDIDTQPIGRDYPVQPGGELAHWDDAPYVHPVPSGIAGPLTVRATLRYQTTSKEYVEFLRDENVSGPDPKDPNYPTAPSRGQKIYDYWSSYGQSAPIDVASAEVEIPVETPSDAPGVVAHGPRGLRLSVEPNPSAHSVVLALEILDEEQRQSLHGAVVEIFDPAGRRIQVLDIPTASETILWTRNGADGIRVPGGVYLARVRGRGGAELARSKLILLD